MSPIVILGASGLFVTFILFLIENPENKNVDPDQMASDLGLHCLPMTFFFTGFPGKNGLMKPNQFYLKTFNCLAHQCSPLR